MSSQTTRILLPAMISISNKSQITESLAITLSEKLSEKELHEFLLWIKIVEGEAEQKKDKRINREYFR